MKTQFAMWVNPLSKPDDLNKRLAKGWRVVKTCAASVAMVPAAGSEERHAYNGDVLVILEKDVKATEPQELARAMTVVPGPESLRVQAPPPLPTGSGKAPPATGELTSVETGDVP